MNAPPALAVVVNNVTPYRVHLHRRIADELCNPDRDGCVFPGGLHSVFTHAAGPSNWQLELPEAIHPAFFATGEEHALDSPLKRPLADWRKGGRILKHLRDHGVRAVILMGYNDLTRIRLLMASRRAGIKVFLRGDSNIKGDRIAAGWKGKLKHAVKRRVMRWVLDRCDGVMPMGELGRQYFERYGVTGEAWRGRVFIVPYEADYSIFQRVDDEALRGFRDAHAIPHDKKHLLFCARLAEVKRPDLALDALKRIADQRPDWRLLIAGEGDLKPTLSQQAARLDIADRITWLGFLQLDQLPLAYHASDAFVLPSDYEPWALVVQEALAAGLPVVATEVVGAAHEMVEDRVNGRLVPPSDLDALAAALLDVTAPENHAAYRAAVGPALQRYRNRCDPVAGIRAAVTGRESN